VTTYMPNLCGSCVHFDKGKCPAFPKGIPDDILLYGGDHRSLWPQQVGTTVHVLKDGEESFFEDWLDTYVFAPD
jgi:hypothetical protein